MDSWAEADFLAHFRALFAGRTAMLITHRFTTAPYADVIHWAEGGWVVESGTHEELEASGGRYAKFWRLQPEESPCPQPESTSP
jgi:ATP-binding cassette subfamily B protein